MEKVSRAAAILRKRARDPRVRLIVGLGDDFEAIAAAFEEIASSPPVPSINHQHQATTIGGTVCAIKSAGE